MNDVKLQYCGVLQERKIAEQHEVLKVAESFTLYSKSWSTSRPKLMTANLDTCMVCRTETDFCDLLRRHVTLTFDLQ